MKKWIRNNLALFVKLCVIVALLIFIIILVILKTNPAICETWTRTFARGWQTAFGTINKYIPFSVTEILLIGIIIASIVLLVLAIINFCKKKGKKGIGKITTIAVMLLSVVTTYTMTVELAYNRDAVPVELYEQKVAKSEFKTIVNHFIDDYNYCASTLTYDENGEITNGNSINELNDIFEEAYKKLDNDYFSSFTARSKPMLTSILYREFQITGLYFGPLGESNINVLSTKAELPFTIAHELAHGKGVMRESDANLVAAYLCLNSSNEYVRYSGYTYTFSSILNLANYTGDNNDYSELRSKLSSSIKSNQNYIYKYWQEHDLLEVIANFFNDLYLKMSGENKGTDSYVDTGTNIGTVDPDTGIEIEPTYSPYLKLYFSIYY